MKRIEALTPNFSRSKSPTNPSKSKMIKQVDNGATRKQNCALIYLNDSSDEDAFKDKSDNLRKSETKNKHLSGKQESECSEKQKMNYNKILSAKQDEETDGRVRYSEGSSKHFKTRTKFTTTTLLNETDHSTQTLDYDVIHTHPECITVLHVLPLKTVVHSEKNSLLEDIKQFINKPE